MNGQRRIMNYEQGSGDLEIGVLRQKSAARGGAAYVRLHGEQVYTEHLNEAAALRHVRTVRGWPNAYFED